LYDVKPSEIAPGVYRLGTEENTVAQLHCNGYLLQTEAGAVVFDPGSVLDYPATSEQIRGILGSNPSIRYVVLHHQDPDVCSGLPRLEKDFGQFEIAAHWRTMNIVRHYGITSRFILVNEKDFRLPGVEGIRFVPAPYLHFPGAVMTYDEGRQILFSGDLFGAFSRDWTLYAGSEYDEAMKFYHEHYMPGNEYLRPVMETLLDLDIKLICPQHGSVIDSNIRDYIALLRDLECGTLGSKPKKSLADAGGYIGVINRIIERYVSVEGREEVARVLEGTHYAVDMESGKLLGIPPGTGDEILEDFFLILYAHGGSRWISLIEPYMRTLAQEYPVSIPSVFYSATVKEQMEKELLIQENKRLQRLNTNLFNNLNRTSQGMTRDQLTGLYNEEFFIQYIRNIFSSDKFQEIAVLFVGVDELVEINKSYGEQEGDRVIRGVAEILDRYRRGNHLVFRIAGPNFVYLYPEGSLHKVLDFSEDLRLAVHRSALFVEEVTVSVGIVRLFESVFHGLTVQERINTLYSLGRSRLGDAREEGGDAVTYRSERPHEEGDKVGRVCILEYDGFHAELLGEALEAVDMDVRISLNGNDAVNTITSFHPDLIISEVYLPEANIFQIKETLEENTRFKDIPVMLVSFQKNEETVVQAQQMGITYFFKKPYIMPEIIGLADILVKRRRFHAH
jgi:diguanylate cyclase (GGDEF)-like protein